MHCLFIFCKADRLALAHAEVVLQVHAGAASAKPASALFTSRHVLFADRLAVMHAEVVAEVRSRLPPEVQLLDQLVGMRDRCDRSICK